MSIYYSLSGSGSSWRSSFLTPSCWGGWGGGGRGGLDLAEWQRWKSRGGGRGGRGSRHTQGTFMEIHCNFCLKVLFFISLKTFLCVISPPSTICFCFSAHITEGSMPYKSQKQSWELRTLLPDCVMSVCFLALLLLGLLPHHPALVRNHSSPSSLFC